jgi:hypothetical protein
MKRRTIEQQLLRDWDWFLELGSSLDEEVLNYEATPDGHDPSVWWTVKDHIAHIYAIARRTHALAEQYLATADGPEGAKEGDVIDFSSNWDDIMKVVNKTTYDVMMEHHEKSWSEIVALGQLAKSERLQLIGTLTDTQLETPIPPPYGTMNGGDGTLGNLLLSDGMHQRMHILWIMKGLATKGQHVEVTGPLER